jgi:hypothetical protein
VYRERDVREEENQTGRGLSMAKLTEKERKGFENILVQDLKAINGRFMSQIKDFWGIARIKVMEQKGWDALEREKDELKEKQNFIKNRIHEIENLMNSEPLRVEQVVELGGKPNEYGRAKDAAFYGIPVTSQFEYEIVDYIRENIDLEVPAKMLRDVCESSIRALVMAGTFEEARFAYEQFYSLDFRKYGVDIPPRLADICKDKNSMLYAQQSLQQIEKGRPDVKLLETPDEKEG